MLFLWQPMKLQFSSVLYFAKTIILKHHNLKFLVMQQTLSFLQKLRNMEF